MWTKFIGTLTLHSSSKLRKPYLPTHIIKTHSPALTQLVDRKQNIIVSIHHTHKRTMPIRNPQKLFCKRTNFNYNIIGTVNRLNNDDRANESRLAL